MPSRVPSLAPTLIPPVECEHEKGLLEISIDMIETIQWEVQDLYGRTMMSSINGRIQECIDLNSCYTFSYRCSVEDGIIENANNHGMFSVVYNDEVLASGSIMFGDHTTMFGNHCLGNGDSLCTLPSDESTPMSMFRLELAVETGMELSWSLLNGTMHEIWSAGAFGDCDVNTLALCLPRMDCYEFTLSNNSANNTGSFTVLFSEVNESMIQNYTGTVHEDSNQRVFLGTCYDMNYNRDDAYSTRRQLLSTV